MRTFSGWFWALSAVLAFGCGGDEGDSCKTGSERCACYGNNTCDDGLTCVLNTCVVLDAGIDGGSDAVQACKDLADAFTVRTIECAEQENGVQLQGDEYQKAYNSTYDTFVRTAVGGGCEKTKKVRDGNALYNECLPELDYLPCNNILAGELPATCQKQLIHD